MVAEMMSSDWGRDVERLGVDALVVTTNVDHGHRDAYPLDRARQLRAWTQLPVAVSGGFGATDHHILSGGDWDIAIIGRSIIEALGPAAAHHTLRLTNRANRTTA